MDNHNFYLVEIKNKDILKDEKIYEYILDIDRKNKDNGFKGINIIDKIDILDDFLNVLNNFLIFIPNDTLLKSQVKFNYGLNYLGFTILKDGEKVYNIFNNIYNIFKYMEDFIYFNGDKLITKESYKYIIENNFDKKENYQKLYKCDILYTFDKIKKFSLKIKEDNFYIIHLGI